ncbi:MAG: preprotein translocase subunit SecE [Candidatus Levybacteria bacterium]|nr:preprotein translocase subunit SecE [Candidatus Levybacteria bacterium]
MATPPVTFVKQALDELKKVKWPTRIEIMRLTISVLIISAIVGVFLGGLDFIFTKGMDLIIK